MVAGTILEDQPIQNQWSTGQQPRLEYGAPDTLQTGYDPELSDGSMAAFVFASGTMHTINADATSTGNLIVASTFYYVYACLAGAQVGFLGLCTMGPTHVANGQSVLGVTGNAAQCYFVGWCYVDAAGHFNDSPTLRHTMSYYNKRRASLLSCPGYTDNNTKTTLGALNNAVFGKINGGTGDSVSYIYTGEDNVELEANFVSNAATTAQCLVGIGESATSPKFVSCIPSVALAGHSAFVQGRFGDTAVDSPGVRTCYMLAMTNSANVTFVSDFPRTGAAADPMATYISGSVFI